MARLTAPAFDAERSRMLAICGGCHSESFARAELRRGDEMVREADRMMAAAIRVVDGLYADGILSAPKGAAPPRVDLLTFRDAPSPIEQRLYEMHLEHRTSAFQGTFHSSPDDALSRGWSELARDLEDIESMAAELRARRKAAP
jgi:hypothetical protein